MILCGWAKAQCRQYLALLLSNSDLELAFWLVNSITWWLTGWNLCFTPSEWLRWWLVYSVSLTWLTSPNMGSKLGSRCWWKYQHRHNLQHHFAVKISDKICKVLKKKKKKCFRREFRTCCMICSKWDYFFLIQGVFRLWHQFLQSAWLWLFQYASLDCTVVRLFNQGEVYSFWNAKMINVCKILIEVMFLLLTSPPTVVWSFISNVVQSRRWCRRGTALQPPPEPILVAVKRLIGAGGRLYLGCSFKGQR